MCSQPPVPKLYVSHTEESHEMPTVGNSSVPVLLTSRLQSQLSTPRQTLIDEMVKEREEKLKKESFPKDHDMEQSQSIEIVDERPKEEFSPEDANMDVRQPECETVDEHGATILEPDDSTSFSINLDRLKVDLSDDRIQLAFCIESRRSCQQIHIVQNCWIRHQCLSFMEKVRIRRDLM